MEIKTGLFEHMVMQRDQNDCCNQIITGKTAAGSALRLCLASGECLASCKADKEGNFRLNLRGLKTGGPYHLVLSSGTERLDFKDILVGDVWMLAGQSNMEGYALLDNAAEPDERIRLYGMDDTWSVAREPLHELGKANAEIHWTLRGGRQTIRQFEEMQKKAGASLSPIRGCGPGLYFSREMLRRHHIPQAVIASAHGGTGMEEWSPELRDKGNDSLYGAMFLRYLRNGASGLAGVLWYQGCNDTLTDEKVARYQERTQALFEAMRRDFKSPELPIVMVQIGRFTQLDSTGRLDLAWSAIREAQRTLAQKMKNILMPSTIDLEYDDDIHLCGKSHARLAQRMADAMDFIRSRGSEGALPIEVDAITHRHCKDTNSEEITVSFKNICGSLHADGGLALGFSLHQQGKEHTLCQAPYRVDLQDNKAILHSTSRQAVKIAYGFGSNPAVTIHDESGQTLPAFGPIFIQPTCRMTPLLSKAECSDPVFGDDAYDLLLPTAEKLSSCRFMPCPAGPFYLAPKRYQDGRNYLYFIRWKVRCSGPVSCLALMGTDGPFRLCCDGREIMGSQTAECPLLLDKYKAPLELSEGIHEFTMGLAGKLGYTWGLSFRIALPDDIITIENEDIGNTLLPEFL